MADLFFFVENLSNETRESFFEHELAFHAERFEKIYIIPLYPDSTALKFNFINVEVLYFNYFEGSNRLKVLFANFPLVIYILLFEFFNTHNRLQYLRNLSKNFNLLLITIGASMKLYSRFKDFLSSKSVVYSYWFTNWAFAFTIIKKWNPDFNLVSRIHGSDYDEAQIGRLHPFRYFQLSKVDKIYSVSSYAKTYMERVFRVQPNKIDVARLGLTIPLEVIRVNPKKIIIVSCSSVIALKRVHLIAELLKPIKLDVEWYHFGDGPLFGQLKSVVNNLPGNIVAHLLGNVPNDVFINFLKTNAVSFFINVSTSEGIPVSMMEAIACSIPLIGTEICGVPEIVTDITGFLIPVDFHPEMVSNLIETQHVLGNIYSLDYRFKIRNFYEANFSANKNYKKFSSELRSLCAE